MATEAFVETGRDRRELVSDAGFGQLSVASVAGGAVAAYGTFAVLSGITASMAVAADADFDVAGRWEQLGVAGGLVVAGLLLLSFLAGGYVAGRMARRAGLAHGAAVVVLGIVGAVVAAWTARQIGGTDLAVDNLRNLGVPTTAAEWRDVATVAGLASLAAMVVGGLLGGSLGERWHAKLVARALDPQKGAEAEARRDAEQRAAEAEALRTASFRRARAATPSRTRRVDGETPGAVEDDADRAPRSRWRRRRDGGDRSRAVRDRRAEQSAGRTG